MLIASVIKESILNHLNHVLDRSERDGLYNLQKLIPDLI